VTSFVLSGVAEATFRHHDSKSDKDEDDAIEYRRFSCGRFDNDKDDMTTKPLRIATLAI